MVQEFINKLPKDKLLHFIAGVMIYQSTFWVIGYYSLALVVVIAIGKEVYDHYYNGTVDVLDAVATVFGGIVCLG